MPSGVGYEGDNQSPDARRGAGVIGYSAQKLIISVPYPIDNTKITMERSFYKNTDDFPKSMAPVPRDGARPMISKPGDGPLDHPR